MTAETMIGFGIIVYAMMNFLVIGIVQCRKITPVGFWTGKEPPKKEEVSDIKAYNRKHGVMWILYGSGMVLCFLAGFFLGNDEIAGIATMVEIVGGLPLLILCHNNLDKKYLTNGGEV